MFYAFCNFTPFANCVYINCVYKLWSVYGQTDRFEELNTSPLRRGKKLCLT